MGLSALNDLEFLEPLSAPLSQTVNGKRALMDFFTEIGKR
jgi:hypothetical protein